MKRQFINNALAVCWRSAFLNDYSTDIMRQNTCNFRNFHAFATDMPRNNFMLHSDVYRANQLWETLPFDLKNSYSLELLEKRLKNWRCTRCPCQICSRFIADVGYISSHQYSFHRILLAFCFFGSRRCCIFSMLNKYYYIHY